MKKLKVLGVFLVVLLVLSFFVAAAEEPPEDPLDIFTIVFTIAALCGILWSLVNYFMEKGLPWHLFDPKYLLRIIPDLLLLYVEFKVLIEAAEIPQTIPLALTAGFVFGWQSDPFIKKLIDVLTRKKKRSIRAPKTPYSKRQSPD